MNNITDWYQLSSQGARDEITRLEDQLQTEKQKRRDSFAGMALQGMLSHEQSQWWSDKDKAQMVLNSIGIADALIAELDKEKI